MSDFINSPQFVTLLIVIFGQAVSHVIILNKVAHRQEYHEKETIRLENLIRHEVMDVEKTIRDHRDELKHREQQHLAAMELMKITNTQILQSLARVETKIELTTKKMDMK